MKILNGLGIALVLFGITLCTIKANSFIHEPYRCLWYGPGLSLGVIYLIPSLIRYIINNLK